MRPAAYSELADAMHNIKRYSFVSIYNSDFSFLSLAGAVRPAAYLNLAADAMHNKKNTKNYY